MAARVLFFLLLLGLPGSPVAAAGLQTIHRGEAVASDWDASQPPSSGWVDVDLVDDWSTRWPDHDGVVWYRVRWQQEDATSPVGLLVDYLCMSGAIYLNGSLLARDVRLVEPLSRSWIKPRYFLVDEPLLRQGENTLLVRVSGLSPYQPGFGTVTVGDPTLVEARFERSLFFRYQIRLVNLAMAAVLGTVFGLLWLLRRKDSVYGWFALSQLAGSLWSYNFVAPSPWPFATTDAWQSFVVAMYMVACASYAIFLLRFGERAFPRVERAIAVVCVVTVVTAFAAPDWLGPNREPWTVVAVTIYYASMIWFLLRALQVSRADYRVLAACLLIPVAATVHDFALFLGWVQGTTYWLASTSVLTLVGIAFALAYRFVGAMRRVEGFNVELQREVDAATSRLGATLAREHALALTHTRARERLQITRDLHDGFGGTLVGAIARLEQAHGVMATADAIDLLKEMRDDLRLVIESTGGERLELMDLLAPLRHRSGQLLETAGIESRWHVEEVEGMELDGGRSLDLLRLLQEALTNVFKHSRATHVDVRVAVDSGWMRVRVEDDGVGMEDAPEAGGRGAGITSMRHRASRLGGALDIASSEGRTLLRVEFPFDRQ